MALTEIKAKKEIGGVEKVAGIAYDFGANLAEATQKFGEEVVFSSFKRTATITAQAAIRRALEAGKSQEEITALMSGWVPGVAMERTIDPVASILGRWDSMSKEEQADLIKKLNAKKK